MKKVNLKLHTVSGKVIAATIQDTCIPMLENYDLDSFVEIPFGKNTIYVNMRNIEYFEVSDM